MEITDYLGYKITELSDSDFVKDFAMKALRPSDLMQGSVRQEQRLPNKPGIYEFRITNRHSIPAGGNVWIDLPPQVFVEDFELKCWSDAYPDEARFCTYDDEFRRIKVFNVTISELVGGT